jgi:hypothetical protein
MIIPFITFHVKFKLVEGLVINIFSRLPGKWFEATSIINFSGFSYYIISCYFHWHTENWNLVSLNYDNPVFDFPRVEHILRSNCENYVEGCQEIGRDDFFGVEQISLDKDRWPHLLITASEINDAFFLK